MGSRRGLARSTCSVSGYEQEEQYKDDQEYHSPTRVTAKGSVVHGRHLQSSFKIE
jgi:hypothetical protein